MQDSLKSTSPRRWAPSRSRSLAAAAPIAGATLGTVGIALAFGLSIVAMAFVIGNVSGCHINPAVTFGLFVDGRISMRDLFGTVAQFVGGIAAAFALLFVVTQCGALGGVAETGLGCNGFDAASSTGLTMTGAIVVEVILTCVFVLTILGVTADGKTSPFAGIVIGLCLTFVHIMGIPLTGTSVNPARSFGPGARHGHHGNTVAARPGVGLHLRPARGRRARRGDLPRLQELLRRRGLAPAASLPGSPLTPAASATRRAPLFRGENAGRGASRGSPARAPRRRGRARPPPLPGETGPRRSHAVRR